MKLKDLTESYQDDVNQRIRRQFSILSQKEQLAVLNTFNLNSIDAAITLDNTTKDQILKKIATPITEAVGHGSDVMDYEKKLNTIVNFLVTFAKHEAKKMVKDPDSEHIKSALEVIEKDLIGKAANKIKNKQYQRSEQRK